jgi:hypothetical protein
MMERSADRRRLSLETQAEISAIREHAVPQPQSAGIVAVAQLDVHAVFAGRRVERAEELPPSQPDGRAAHRLRVSSVTRYITATSSRSTRTASEGSGRSAVTNSSYEVGLMARPFDGQNQTSHKPLGTCRYRPLLIGR